MGQGNPWVRLQGDSSGTNEDNLHAQAESGRLDSDVTPSSGPARAIESEPSSTGRQPGHEWLRPPRTGADTTPRPTQTDPVPARKAARTAESGGSVGSLGSAAEASEASEAVYETTPEPAPAPTGPVAPQPRVPMPAQGLPLRTFVDEAALGTRLWVVGAHGGAGESTLSELYEAWRAAEHGWPVLVDDAPAPCVLTARTSVRGLLAARTALTQWAASGAGGSVRLLGLVLIADAPGRLPEPIRDLATVVGGGAPRVWHLPWVEEWRLGDPVTDRASRPLRKAVASMRAVIAPAEWGAGPTSVPSTQSSSSSSSSSSPSHHEEKS